MIVEPRIVINSLPKAGTNLVSKLYDLAGLSWNHVCLDSRLILRANPWTRAWRKLRQCHGNEVLVGIGAPVSVPASLVERQFQRLAPRQYLKAHVGYTTAIARMAHKHEIVRVVVIRDPRDVIVSQVHYALNTPRHFLHRAFTALGDREQCFNAAIDGGYFSGVFLENIRTRCLSLDPWLRYPFTMVVRFEDLVGAGGGGDEGLQIETIRKLLRSSRIDKTEDEVRAIARELYGPGKRTFRKGQIGEAWNEMTPAQLVRMDEMLGDIYAQWGYAPSGARTDSAGSAQPRSAAIKSP